MLVFPEINYVTSLIYGSFHLLMLVAEGDTLCPFNNAIVENLAGAGSSGTGIRWRLAGGVVGVASR